MSTTPNSTVDRIRNRPLVGMVEYVVNSLQFWATIVNVVLLVIRGVMFNYSGRSTVVSGVTDSVCDLWFLVVMLIYEWTTRAWLLKLGAYIMISSQAVPLSAAYLETKHGRSFKDSGKTDIVLFSLSAMNIVAKILLFLAFKARSVSANEQAVLSDQIYDVIVGIIMLIPMVVEKILDEQASIAADYFFTIAIAMYTVSFWTRALRKFMSVHEALALPEAVRISV